jgi:hypothetical protein
MAYRVLKVNLISANDLKVTLFSRLRVYAVASISGGDHRIPTHKTLADYVNGCNPAWNATVDFPIPDATDTRGLALHVKLRTERAFFGDRDVGEVYVPVDDLLTGANKGGDPRPVSYQVRRPHSGRAHGVLYFCYKFTDVPAAGLSEPEAKQGQYTKYVQDSEVVMGKTMMSPPPTTHLPPSQAMPAYPSAQGMPGCLPAQYGYGSSYAAYPPQQQPYGYAASPPYGCNAAPQQTAADVWLRSSSSEARWGYGDGARPRSPRSLGGAVGGMMLGEMVGDYETNAAYDAGFNYGLEY